MWDELAAIAWLGPKIITRTEKLYLDTSIDQGPSYGDTLAWEPGKNPGIGEQLVIVNTDLDKSKFEREFIDLMTRATLQSHFSGDHHPSRP